MKKINRFFWHCSGADISMLEQCPTEASKYAGLGATIFFTGLLAALAGGYAVHTVFDNYWISVAFGILWGLMIFNLDRYIISSMRKEGRFSRELLSAIPRVVLAVLISIVIAKPLELKIFQREIDPELEVMKQEMRAAQETEVKSRFESERARLFGEIQSLSNEVKLKEEKRNELARLAQEEADGTGGSKRRNLGPIYKVKREDADRAEAELSELRLTNMQRIRALEVQLAHSDSARDNATSQLKEITSGFAARLDAMSRLTSKSSAMWWGNFFLILLFVILETSPVMVKLISRKGPYDNLLRIEEHRFSTSESEKVAKNSAEARKQLSSLPEEESIYLSRNLDAELK